ncbi:hypothetical protein [Pseudomonas sp. efr-133-TYG-103a]|jgi:uncharacterized protein RhaS with RHS repeats|uniref:hypothetical protein n=1 Tax=Pseudomonas sp. efr-133-TYG-103a TaxID=3040308 RepID=UPI00255356CA|nr:hypothetical protein [Pseudomonas sp. efr-133-TYG-103a]
MTGINHDFSRLIEEANPLGRTTTYKHHLGTTLITETTFPDRVVWQARYDVDGNSIAGTAALGR